MISHSEGFYYPENNIALTTKTKGMFYSFQQKVQKKIKASILHYGNNIRKQVNPSL